jgi:hypothetical protein
VSIRPEDSIELVGEFFEGRTQVDLELTTVGRVDRRLGLIKNLGLHTILKFKYFMIPWEVSMKFGQFKPLFQILQIMENTMLACILRNRQR